MSLLTQFYPGPGGGEVTVESLALGMLGAWPIVFYDPEITGSASCALAFNVQRTYGGLAVGLQPSTFSAPSFLFGNSGDWSMSSEGFRKAIGLGVANNGGVTVSGPITWTFNGLESLTNFSVWAPSAGLLSLTIVAPSLTTLSGVGVTSATATTFVCDSSPNLTTVTNFIGNITSSGPLNVSIQNANLTVASVENILFALDQNTNAAIASGTLNLQGGTSAGAGALSPAGTAAVTSLQAKGMTVLLRP